MDKIELNDILESNEWFVSSEESDVLELIESQKYLSGLAQNIIAEDLDQAEEIDKNLFYSLFGTILRSYKVSYPKEYCEVTEEEIEKSFEKQNKFAEKLSETLGFSGDTVSDMSEDSAMQMMEKLEGLEEKFKENKDFNLEDEGMEGLVELIGEVNGDMYQPSMIAFLQSEIESLDDNTAGFINQYFTIIIDSLELMINRGENKTNMKIV